MVVSSIPGCRAYFLHKCRSKRGFEFQKRDWGSGLTQYKRNMVFQRQISVRFQYETMREE